MLIGITGNLGSGKSTLRRVLERLGYSTYDADDMVAELYKQGQVIDMIGTEFGPEVVEKGAVDRKLLASYVFNSAIKLKRLNQIIHPLIIEKISRIRHQGTLVFVEVPLLFEAHMERLFDKIILAKAPHEVCKGRAIKKGYAEEEFEKRVAAQFTADRISKRADFAIDTDDSVAALSEKVKEITDKLSASNNWRGV